MALPKTFVGVVLHERAALRELLAWDNLLPAEQTRRPLAAVMRAAGSAVRMRPSRWAQAGETWAGVS